MSVTTFADAQIEKQAADARKTLLKAERVIWQLRALLAVEEIALPDKLAREVIDVLTEARER